MTSTRTLTPPDSWANVAWPATWPRAFLRSTVTSWAPAPCGLSPAATRKNPAIQRWELWIMLFSCDLSSYRYCPVATTRPMSCWSFDGRRSTEVAHQPASSRAHPWRGRILRLEGRPGTPSPHRHDVDGLA